MLTPTQKKTIQAIVNVFETGSARGDYGRVTVIRGDTGHLSYGRSQATLGSGTLHTLLAQYCANPGARFGARLAPYLERFAARDLSLDVDRHLQNLLRAAADDPVMRETQDQFFEQQYWQPAARAASQLGVDTPLGLAVLYDSTVHGSRNLIRDKTQQLAGPLEQCGERAWIRQFVSARRDWLAGHTRRDLHATVYRMDAFQRLLDLDSWGLELPLVVRGVEISDATLEAAPAGCYDGPQPGSRVLWLQSPMMRGLDVRLVQLGLSALGFDILADGVYGNASIKCVKQFQTSLGLPATGVADAALIARLAA